MNCFFNSHSRNEKNKHDSLGIVTAKIDLKYTLKYVNMVAKVLDSMFVLKYLKKEPIDSNVRDFI